MGDETVGTSIDRLGDRLVTAITGGVPTPASIQALYGHGSVGAASLTSDVTTYEGDTVDELDSTLAAGTEGQLKTLTFIATDDYPVVITVTGLLGGTIITLSAVGDTIILQYLGSQWIPQSIIGAVIS